VELRSCVASLSAALDRLSEGTRCAGSACRYSAELAEGDQLQQGHFFVTQITRLIAANERASLFAASTSRNKRLGVASAKGMTIMTNIQATKVLSAADLDAVVGGFLPPVLAAFEIKQVERSNEPNAIKAEQIHNIEAALRWPFGRF
jgi:hypothetical protein